MIELTDVCKSYDGGATHAVDNVSLAIEQGELIGLIGESGCGKTTTLKMINRLEEPSSGTIRVNGEDVRDRDPVELRRGIGYVFQGVGLFPHYTVAQNVAAVPELLNWSAPDIRERVDEVLDIVGLAPDQYRDRRPSELSGGQQQRVGVARALAARPSLILMDEPFGALDPITRAELQEEFLRIHRALNLTAIMVTHDMSEALLMADRIAVMKDGKILQFDTPHVLLNHPAHEFVQQMIALPKQRADSIEALMDGHAP
ncbi:MAG: ABC transporter ATP-binding protein [Halioglobus sp.]